MSRVRHVGCLWDSKSTTSRENSPDGSSSVLSEANDSKSESLVSAEGSETRDEPNLQVELPQYRKKLAIRSSSEAEKAFNELREHRVSRLTDHVRLIFEYEYASCNPSDGSSDEKGNDQTGPSASASSTFGVATYGRSEGKRPIRTTKNPTWARGDEDEDDDDTPKVTPKRQRRSAQTPLYGCHFYVKNPLMHVLRSSCKTGFPTVHRIKEHFKRCHMAPKYYCPICYTKFSDAVGRDAHIKERARNLCPDRPEPEIAGITEAQWDRMQQPKKKKKGNKLVDDLERDKWEEIWRIIFDGQHVPSPYFQDPATLVGPDLTRFMSYFHLHYREAFRPLFLNLVSSESLGLQNLTDVESSLLDVEQVFGTMVSDFQSQYANQSKAAHEDDAGDHTLSNALVPESFHQSDLRYSQEFVFVTDPLPEGNYYQDSIHFEPGISGDFLGQNFVQDLNYQNFSTSEFSADPFG